MNRIIKDAFYNVNNYSDFDKCENVVELKDVVKYYNNGYIATKVLDHVNLKIKKGEFVVILGPSGSGKTTLLNIISGMDNATYGEVLIANENLIDYDQTQLTTFRRRNIGYVFQQYGLLPNLTVKENIQMGQNLQSNKAKILDIEMILESIGLISQINKYPNELSGGQQQRVSIARSIAKNPNILFGDEPTGAIDVEMSKEIMRLFTEVNNRFKTTIIIVTHNPIIAELATMVIHVANGTISKIVKNEHPKTVDDLDWATVVKNKK
ncbi:MAG: ABC transporter ATP-binding protein [Malacoplasma sp.]|nr:ABC transporter ATP-binding protein [Malacoplasma sp.]